VIWVGRGLGIRDHLRGILHRLIRLSNRLEGKESLN